MAMLRSLCATLLAVGAIGASAAPPAAVADLAWMTGAWAGDIGDGQTLEENWIEPTDGSIAALVRITGKGLTSMVELIVIEQVNNTLMLRIQQWGPDFAPRSPSPQTLALTEIGERRVAWKAQGEGAIRTLAYARPTPDAFTIDVQLAEGPPFRAELQAQ